MGPRCAKSDPTHPLASLGGAFVKREKGRDDSQGGRSGCLNSSGCFRFKFCPEHVKPECESHTFPTRRHCVETDPRAVQTHRRVGDSRRRLHQRGSTPTPAETDGEASNPGPDNGEKVNDTEDFDVEAYIEQLRSEDGVGVVGGLETRGHFVEQVRTC